MYMRHFHPGGDRSQCPYCRNNIPFELPNELYKAVLDGTLVVFAGAGVSSESNIMPVKPLYEEVSSLLPVRRQSELPFPDIMTEFSNNFGRAALLRKIKEHFDYISSFSELYGLATRFHQELATMFPISEIITTNWDDYFERECGATAFVAADDFTFWNVPGRRVLKIHGSVNAFGSIVATRNDYERCYQRLSRGLLGSNLKVALATKTLLYIGFSFHDDDFARIHKYLTREMRGTIPRSYLVTLDRSSDAQIAEIGVQPIYTDATFFLSRLKERLVADKHMIADQRYNGIWPFYERVLRAHDGVSAISFARNPDIMYCLAYQDGLQHALARIMTFRRTGEYSHACKCANTIASYSEKVRPEKLRAHAYPTVAYVDGYVNGHMYFVLTDKDRRACPLYYVFGCRYDLRSFADFRAALRDSARFHKAAHNLALQFVKRGKIAEGMLFHHPPVF
jgi:hypothetical protein